MLRAVMDTINDDTLLPALAIEMKVYVTAQAAKIAARNARCG